MIETALFADLLVVVVCSILLLRYGRLSHSHPGTIYLFFHIYTFTLRLIGIAFGAATLFSEYLFYFEPVRDSEIARATATGDLALVVMTIAWIKASRDDHRKRLKQKHTQVVEKGGRSLSLAHIWGVVAVAFPLGVIGLLAFSNLPGVETDTVALGEWQTSSWSFITQVWAGLTLLALIYWYGFRWWLMVPMSLYLLVMAYQGYHRFRVIIPALLLIQIYLDRRNLKWPPIYIMCLLVLLMAMFFPLKDIGRMAQQGEGFVEIFDTSKQVVNSALSVEAGDQEFLDQYACALTLIDENDRFYYGSTYLALITLPVPRPWWPEKPGLADYIKDFSRPWRPMSEAGMIVTFLGESYANFGYFGIVFVPFLLAYLLARAYFRAYLNNYFSVGRLAYLLVACNLIQVYRDGLLSIVVFTWVNMMPLMVIVALHYFLPPRPALKKSAQFTEVTYQRPTAQ